MFVDATCIIYSSISILYECIKCNFSSFKKNKLKSGFYLSCENSTKKTDTNFS